MGAQWEFVASNPDGADAESKRTVRKAAMRAFRRNQRLERMQQFKKPGTTSPPESDKSSSSHAEEVKVIKRLKVEQGLPPRALPNNSLKSPNEEVPSVPYAPVEHIIDYWPICANRSEPSPTTPLSNGVDQAVGFSSPIGCGGPSNYQLLNHFVTQTLPSLNSLGTQDKNPITTEWIHHALIDPALFQSILFHASVHLDHRLNRPWSPTTIYHRGETIRLLNERLITEEAWTDDNMIAAVGLFGNAGNITGDFKEDQIHKSALSKMIQLKGGTSSLGWNGALETILSIGDMISSGVSSSPPTLFPPSPPATPTVTDFPTFTPSPDNPEKEILDAIQALSSLATTLTTLTNNPNLTPADIIAFHSQRGIIEHRLLTIQIPPSITPEAYMYEAARLATLICINHTFRSFASHSAVITALLSQLMKILQKVLELHMMCGTDNLQKRDLEMMLWVSFVAGIHAKEKDYFGQLLSSAIVYLGLESAGEIEGVLRSFLWTDEMQRNECVGWWQGVGVVGGSGKGSEVIMEEMSLPVFDV